MSKKKNNNHNQTNLIGNSNNANFLQQREFYYKKGVDPDKLRKVYDNIHGFIYFPQKIWDFIDTPHFQRLRNIKQLGTLSYVFPGATHSRFEHSIGTGYLAKKYVQKIIEKQPELYKIQGKNDKETKEKTEKNIKEAIFTVTLAGVMHDIGHGPYSHAFDGTVIGDQWKQSEKSKIYQKWQHEIASQKIFETLIRDNKKIQIEHHLKERVKALIRGRQKDAQQNRQQPWNHIRPWQFQLISNKLTGIDVDKWDYFRRDSFYLGAKNIYIDYELLMQESRVLKEQGYYYIAYPKKYYEKVMDIYHSRYKLYKTYYLNKISLGIESMICNIMSKMSKHPSFNLLKKCQDVIDLKTDGYTGLTDQIINKIDGMNDSDGQNAKQAKTLLKRIRQRDIYRFVMSCQNFFDRDISKDEQLKKIFDKKLIKQFIINNAKKSRKNLQEKDVFVIVGDISFGMKKKNPFLEVKFFNKGDDKILDHIDPSTFTLLNTNFFIEKYICVYSTQDKEQKFDLIADGLSKYIDAKKLDKNTELHIGLNKNFTPRSPNNPFNENNADRQKPNQTQMKKGMPKPGSKKDKKGKKNKNDAKDTKDTKDTKTKKIRKFKKK